MPFDSCCSCLSSLWCVVDHSSRRPARGLARSGLKYALPGDDPPGTLPPQHLHSWPIECGWGSGAGLPGCPARHTRGSVAGQTVPIDTPHGLQSGGCWRPAGTSWWASPPTRAASTIRDGLAPPCATRQRVGPSVHPVSGGAQTAPRCWFMRGHVRDNGTDTEKTSEGPPALAPRRGVRRAKARFTSRTRRGRLSRRRCRCRRWI
jgi:hypothetical protein